MEGKCLEATKDGIALGRGIQLSLYDQWASKETVGKVDSSNHGALGALCDLVNLWNKRDTILSRSKQISKAWDYLNGPLLDREAFARGVYMTWAMEYMLGCRELWKVLGEPDLSIKARDVINSLFAWIALGAKPTRCKIMDEDIARIPGPGVFAATLDDPRGKNYPSVSVCGARSANRKPAGTVGQKPPPGAVYKWRHLVPTGISDELAAAIRGGVGGEIGRALQGVGMNGTWVNQLGAVALNGCLVNDLDRFDIALGEAKNNLPKYPFRIIRTEDSVVTVCLEGPDGSTATLDATRVDNNGDHFFLISNFGNRDAKGGQDSVKPTHAIVTRPLNHFVITAQVDDGSLPEASMTIPGSQIILDVEFGGPDKRFIVHDCLYKAWLDNQKPPVVVVPPEPPAEKQSFWDKVKEFFSNLFN